MQKPNRLQHLISASLSVCLLLSFTISFLTNSAVGRDNLLSSTAYDGSVLPAATPIDRFNRIVLQNDSAATAIKSLEYHLLSTVQSDNVIAGKQGFLFEIEDKKTGYNYLNDYQGKLHFSNEEKRAILKELRRREEMYAAQDADYLLVIIPNSQTVYSENMPNYIGDMTDRTRLDDLDTYLRGHLFNSYLNLTDALLAAKADGPLYHNTENALTSLGLYYLYREICATVAPSLLGDEIIAREELSFMTYETAGRRLSKQAGLTDIVKNYTVALQNDELNDYSTLFVSGYISKTMRLPRDGGEILADGPSLLMQFSDAGSRLLAEPYFSCTFDHVTYQSNLFENSFSYELAAPNLVIQVVYEYELSNFLHN